MRYLIISLLLFYSSRGIACYNEYYALDSKGKFHAIAMDQIHFDQYFDQQKIEKQLLLLGQKLKKNPDYKLLSNYGLHLVQAGKVKEALVIFEKLAKLHPNEYSIISNLGTTYELSGQNEKALEYIRKGLKLNPDSHGGSEWIHVKILEAKIALEKDPGYLTGNSVLKLDSKQKQSNEVFNQLFIQLNERFPFSPKGPNPIMADLFVELGDHYFDQVSFEHAKAFYQVAKFYYQSDRKDIDQKIEAARKLRKTYSEKQPEAPKMEHGESTKIVGVPYQNYIYNPYGSSHKINWSKIESDPAKLLGYLGIKAETPEDGNDSLKAEKTAVKTKTVRSVKSTNNSMLWIGLTLTVLIISIFTYFKTKKKKR